MHTVITSVIKLSDFPQVETRIILKSVF